MNKFTREQIENALNQKGYHYFDDYSSVGYDVNIVGIRNTNTGDDCTNYFDDWLTVSYKEPLGDWVYHEWPITTDPGRKALIEFSNISGVARLVPSQYRSAYYVGYHQGKYESLKQRKEVTVYRDDNMDMTYDEDRTQTGFFGINIHKAGYDSKYVENWSEGCQVFKRSDDFIEFMEIIKCAKDIWGNTFSYTLLELKDL